MNHENLNLYYVFFITAQTGNISHAARRLYISQPAVSKAISKLEDELETRLFVRNSRGVRLTPEGNTLFLRLKDAFSMIEQGEEDLKKTLQLGMGHLSIGASTTLCKYVLLPKLPEYMRQNPYVKLSLSCHSTKETLQGLQNSSLDLGLVGEPEKTGPCKFYPLREIHDIFVTTDQYLKQLALQEKNADFSNVTLLVLDQDNLTRQYVEQYLAKYQLSPASVLEVGTMDLLIEFAKAGLGVACVIKEFVEQELQAGQLCPFPTGCDSIPARKIGFVYNSRQPMNSFMQKFIQLFLM